MRDTFGRNKIADVKYSDVLQFYYHLLNERKIALGTLDSIQCILHPTFQLAVRDEIIRINPTDGVIKEISRESGKSIVGGSCYEIVRVGDTAMGHVLLLGATGTAGSAIAKSLLSATDCHITLFARHAGDVFTDSSYTVVINGDPSNLEE